MPPGNFGLIGYRFKVVEGHRVGYEAISGRQKEVSSRSVHFEQDQSTFSLVHLMPLSVVQEILHLPPHLGQVGETTSWTFKT